MELSERKLKILAAIVNTYVETGEPVGSKLLALELGVSSATIRNEMANLVEMDTYSNHILLPGVFLLKRDTVFI
ncbi:MAG: hypothetical protein ACLSCV_07970 [Acutalibacteraceae bacterium]